MNVYVWQCVAKCTDHYHEEGGVVVVAASVERARELAAAQGCKISDEEAHDAEIPCAAGEPERVFIFPDSGCC